MAKYTIEFRDVVAHYPVFAFPYAFYDEKKRQDFERKFIQHFYFREICCPEVDRFLHYLRDKMETVFPYYNELMNTAAIEYSVLDNYNVTETFERKYENTGKTNGVSSTVGQVMDEQNTETNTQNESEISGNSNIEREVSGEEKFTGKVDRSLTGNDTNRKETESSGNNQIQDTRRFLDTPQGKLDLTDLTYLTTLNQDTKMTVDSMNGTENVTGTRSEDDVTDTDNTKTDTQNENQNQTTKTDETSSGKSETNFSGNQKSTSDNNTRMERHDEHIESYELKKKGNIGVDTDADMIQKHINLQKVLTQIENMFFNECEDLFMLVW